MAHFFVYLSSANKRTTSTINESLDTIGMEVVNHLALLLGALGFPLTIHLLESELDGFDELFDLRLMNKDVVRGDANLS